MSNQTLQGSPYNQNAVQNVKVDSNYTFDANVRTAQVIAGGVTVTLATTARPAHVGEVHYVAAAFDNVIVDGGQYPILGGGVSVTAGSEARYELCVVPVTPSTPDGFAWVPSAAGGAFGVGEIVVPDIDALAALPAGGLVGGLPDQIRARVLKLDGIFELDKTSSAGTDGITIVAAGPDGSTPGVGRWLRIENFSKKWSLQILWFVDPANGSDENDGRLAVAVPGTSEGPLKTSAEVCRRLHLALTGKNYQIVFTNDVPLVGSLNPHATVQISDRIRPSWLQSPNAEEQLANGFQQVINASFIGQPIVAFGNQTMTGGVQSAGNVQANFTDATFPGQVGDIILIKDGPAAGATAGVGFISGATVSVSEFLTVNNAAAPAPGNCTYDVIRPTKFNPPVTQYGISQGRYFFSFLTFPALAGTDQGVNDTYANYIPLFNRCVFNRSINLGDNCVATFLGCVFNYTGVNGTGISKDAGGNNVVLSAILNSAFSSTGTLFVEADVRLVRSSDSTFTSCYFEKSVLSTVNPAPGFTNYGFFTVGANATQGGRIQISNVGIYRWPTAARAGLLLADQASAKVIGANPSLRGLGPNLAVFVRGGMAQLQILDGITPTITVSAGVEIRIENPLGNVDFAVRAGQPTLPLANPVTPPGVTYLSSSIGTAGPVVLDAQSLGSWSNWNTVFNRFAFNPHTGSRIISVPTA